MKVWHDPVWSKVIASVIIAAMGVVYSCIKGCANDPDTILETLRQVFCYKVNLWIALGCFMCVWTISSFFKRKSVVASERPEPLFMKEFVEGKYLNQTWRWNWKWSSTYNLYYITNLNIICPICHDGLLTLDYMSYRCAKCNADIPYGTIMTTKDAVEKQILEDARQRYSDYADKIGEFPKSIVKG